MVLTTTNQFMQLTTTVTQVAVVVVLMALVQTLLILMVVAMVDLEVERMACEEATVVAVAELLHLVQQVRLLEVQDQS
jgi:hypothetical protein